MTATGDSPVKKKHSRYKKTFLRSLSEEERRLRSRKIPRASLLLLDLSPWRTLLDSAVNQSLITMTGFDGASFASLLQKFAPLFDEYTFERRTPNEGSSGGLSWSCARLDLHERVPNGVAVGFWDVVLESLHVFALRPPRDHRGIEE